MSGELLINYTASFCRGKLAMTGQYDVVNHIIEPLNVKLDVNRSLPPHHTDIGYDLTTHMEVLQVRHEKRYFIICNVNPWKLWFIQLCTIDSSINYIHQYLKTNFQSNLYTQNNKVDVYI